jgi:tripartite-type tricarboxylate transporter receptor subunit TctC
MKKSLAAVLALLACTFALAQAPLAAPGPTVVLVVGGPPGNPGDLLLRALSAPLGAELGQAVVVENRPGAAGTIALASVARARPDGNTFGLLALQSAVAPALLPTLPYDTLRDLTPVRQLSWVGNVLVVKPDSAWQSLDDVVRAGRAAALTFASGGNGTPAHLAAALFAQQTGVQLQHVPFGGAQAGVNAVLGGHVQLMFATVPSVAGLLQAGKLRALAGAAPPGPTPAERGLPGAGLRDWHGLVAPAGTPRERIVRVAEALDKVLASEAVRQQLAQAGLEIAAGSTPDGFRAFVGSEVARWAEVVRRAGITLQ